MPLSQLGALIPKSVTVAPRSGNIGPRLAESPCGLVNSIGLQNEGINAFIEHKLPGIADAGCPIIVNIAGFTLGEFAYMARRLDKLDSIQGIEVNISCPNVKKGGMQFGIEAASAASVMKAVRENTSKTVIVKLSPNVTDIALIACAVESEGADAVSLINTLSAIAVDSERRKPILGNVFGGLSGPAIKPVALRMVLQAYRAVKIPIIGLGGITSAADVIEFFLCGASAVQVGTAFLTNPTVFADILEGLRNYCRRHSFNRIGEITGLLETS